MSFNVNLLQSLHFLACCWNFSGTCNSNTLVLLEYNKIPQIYLILRKGQMRIELNSVDAIVVFCTLIFC